MGINSTVFKVTIKNIQDPHGVVELTQDQFYLIGKQIVMSNPKLKKNYLARKKAIGRKKKE